MTVRALHKLLGKLIEDGIGHTAVRIDKPTYTHPLEGDGAVVLDIHRVEVQVLPNIDDDGGMKVLANGRMSMARTVVLSGIAERCKVCYAVECLCGVTDSARHAG